jgi:predicted transcriptional regulator
MEQKLYICYTQNTETMDLQADLKWIHQELDNVKDPILLEAIKNILKYRRKVSSERISIEQYNEEIDASIADIEAGNYHTHEEVKDMIKQWGKR